MSWLRCGHCRASFPPECMRSNDAGTFCPRCQDLFFEEKDILDHVGKIACVVIAIAVIATALRIGWLQSQDQAPQVVQVESLSAGQGGAK